MKFSSQSDVFQRDRVAPFVGVWIEIVYDLEDVEEVSVAPFVGVWIEIYTEREGDRKRSVAPFVGVWIEIIQRSAPLSALIMSIPSQECRFNYILLGVGYINIYKLSSIL